MNKKNIFIIIINYKKTNLVYLTKIEFLIFYNLNINIFIYFILLLIYNKIKF